MYDILHDIIYTLPSLSSDQLPIRTPVEYFCSILHPGICHLGLPRLMIRLPKSYFYYEELKTSRAVHLAVLKRQLSPWKLINHVIDEINGAWPNGASPVWQ